MSWVRLPELCGSIRMSLSPSKKSATHGNLNSIAPSPCHPIKTMHARTCLTVHGRPGKILKRRWQTKLR